MRLNRTLPLAFFVAALAALVSGCVEPGIAPPSPPSGEPGAPGGHPLADGGGPGEAEVDPGRLRIELTISATGSLKPGVDVELTVKGVAREQVDGGEVVLTLPTRALMDHNGKGSPDRPAVASWVLPAIAKGGTWSGSHTVPGEAAGWYRVMANAYTRGPDGGPWLFDAVLASAWMHVAETGGRLTRVLEDSVAAGPAAGWPGTPPARDPDYPFWHPDSVYIHVVYSVSQRRASGPRWTRCSGPIRRLGGAVFIASPRTGSWPYGVATRPGAGPGVGRKSPQPSSSGDGGTSDDG